MHSHQISGLTASQHEAQTLHRGRKGSTHVTKLLTFPPWQVQETIKQTLTKEKERFHHCTQRYQVQRQKCAWHRFQEKTKIQFKFSHFKTLTFSFSKALLRAPQKSWKHWGPCLGNDTSHSGQEVRRKASLHASQLLNGIAYFLCSIFKFFLLIVGFLCNFVLGSFFVQFQKLPEG